MILDEVIEELGLAITANGLGSMMTATNSSNSQVITLTVQNEDPRLAQEIANLTAEIFTAEVLENFNMDNVRILAQAQLPRTPISPRLSLNIAISFIIGTIAGIGLAFLLEFLDQTVKTEKEAEMIFGTPILGMVPTITTEDMIAKKPRGEYVEV